MKKIYINACGTISSIGNDILSMYKNALNPENNFLTPDDTIIKGKKFYFAKVKSALEQIKNTKYNIRANRLLLNCVSQIKSEIDNAIKKYGQKRVGVVIGTTNSGVDEYALTGNIVYSQIGNPAGF